MTLIQFVDGITTQFQFQILSNEERRSDTENDYNIENESSKTYIDSDSDFSSSASFFSGSKQKKSKDQPTAAQTTQFIMVPGLNGQFVNPAQLQQSPIVQPIVIQAAQPTAPPSIRLPQVSLNLVAPGRQVGLALGGQLAPLQLANQMVGFGGGRPLRRGRGRGRGRGRRRRRPGMARLRQAAMLSAAIRAQQLQQQPQPQMQVLQPIILQPSASSTLAPLREQEAEKQVEKVHVVHQPVVQPVVQPIIAQPVVQPINVPVIQPEIESTTSLRQHLSHIADEPAYHRVVPSYTRVRRPYPSSPYSSSYHGYSAGRTYYRTPGGGIVNQIVIQPPENQGKKSIFTKTKKKMRAKMAKKLIKMLKE